MTIRKQRMRGGEITIKKQQQRTEILQRKDRSRTKAVCSGSPAYNFFPSSYRFLQGPTAEKTLQRLPAMTPLLGAAVEAPRYPTTVARGPRNPPPRRVVEREGRGRW